MKLTNYTRNQLPGWGVVTETGIAPLFESWPTIGEGLAAGRAALVAALAKQSQRIALDDVVFTAPVAPATKILCVGINYGLHIAEMRREVPANPSVFVRFADSFVGHGQPIVCPAASNKFDFEAELAIVIGRTCRHATPERALDYVGGYTCLGDNSVRDFQKHAAQVTPGKNWEHSGSIGPWIVTADEIPDVQNLRVQCHVNGVRKQDSNTRFMIFPVARLIEELSLAMTLLPGDILLTGTPEGVGYARTPPEFLRPGDEVTVSVEGVGEISNRVVRKPLTR